ncbi:MAG: tetratricopeptide repeat protein [Terracidiphilus sp.]|jgi:tetratricopeptide (TPR) repeat protein
MRPSTSTRRILFLVTLCLVTGVAALSQTASHKSPSSQLQSSQLQDAATELSAGKLDQAEQDLQSVLRSNPGDYRALDLLGVVRVLQHKEAKAEELFEQVVKANPDFAPGHAHLGLLYSHLGRTLDALPELHQALRLDPGRTDVAGALVHILQDQAKAASDTGNWNSALDLILEAKKYAPDNADVQYELGVTAQKLSLTDDAIAAFQQTLKLRKNDALAMFYLGFELMDRARYDDARQQFAQYVAIRPDDPSGYGALGMALAALGRAEEARAQFERSIALAPTQSESYYQLGLLDRDVGDYDRATLELQKVLKTKPRDAGALTALGRVEFEQKHYAEAISALRQAVSQDDSLQEAHYYLGLALARLGRKQESNEQLESAARLEQEQKERSRNILRIREPEDFEKQQPNSPQ